MVEQCAWLSLTFGIVFVFVSVIPWDVKTALQRFIHVVGLEDMNSGSFTILTFVKLIGMLLSL